MSRIPRTCKNIFLSENTNTTLLLGLKTLVRIFFKDLQDTIATLHVSVDLQTLQTMSNTHVMHIYIYMVHQNAALATLLIPTSSSLLSHFLGSKGKHVAIGKSRTVQNLLKVSIHDRKTTESNFT
jgi:hypothetical protein